MTLKEPIKTTTIWVAILLLVVVISILGWQAITVTKWVGRGNLQMTVTVLDRTTGKPIPNTAVTAWMAESDEGQVVWEQPTDNNGRLTIEREQLTSGSSGMFEDTAFINLPPWKLTTAAIGYNPGEPVNLYFLPQPERPHEANLWKLPITIYLDAKESTNQLIQK